MNVAALVAQAIALIPARMATYNYSFGVHTSFFTLTDDVGVRIYRNTKYAQLSCAAQHMAAKLGFAPKVLSSVYVCGDGEEFSFYLTEVVQVAGEYLRNIRYDDSDDAEYFSERSRLMCTIDTIAEKLTAYGYKVTDTHDGNYGLDKDGNVVLIDFSNAIWTWQANGSPEFSPLTQLQAA
jgi:hypothetical protein